MNLEQRVIALERQLLGLRLVVGGLIAVACLVAVVGFSRDQGVIRAKRIEIQNGSEKIVLGAIPGGGTGVEITGRDTRASLGVMTPLSALELRSGAYNTNLETSPGKNGASLGMSFDHHLRMYQFLKAVSTEGYQIRPGISFVDERGRPTRSF